MKELVNESNNRPQYWALVPAAGAGRRLGSATPKQYLPLHGQAVLIRTLERLASHPNIGGIVLVLSADDEYWAALNWSSPVQLLLAVGGEHRCQSVLNGLQKLQDYQPQNDWILVHDGARPCLHHDDISALLSQLAELKEQRIPGLVLGGPVADTLKRTDSQGGILATLDRELLYRAFTPQVFVRDELASALKQCAKDGFLPTDEASAMEHSGKYGRMVAGRSDNIKITHPGDLALAEEILRQQEQILGLVAQE